MNPLFKHVLVATIFKIKILVTFVFIFVSLTILLLSFFFIFVRVSFGDFVYISISFNSYVEPVIIRLIALLCVMMLVDDSHVEKFLAMKLYKVNNIFTFILIYITLNIFLLDLCADISSLIIFVSIPLLFP